MILTCTRRFPVQTSADYPEWGLPCVTIPSQRSSRYRSFCLVNLRRITHRLYELHCLGNCWTTLTIHTHYIYISTYHTYTHMHTSFNMHLRRLCNFFIITVIILNYTRYCYHWPTNETCACLLKNPFFLYAEVSGNSPLFTASLALSRAICLNVIGLTWYTEI